MDYRQEMKELRDTLNAHGYRYYVLDEPTISDYEYDHMLRRLEDLEAAHPEEITPDSPTQRIGGRTLSEFQQVTHPVPLESLQDVFNDDEVCQFLEKIPLDAPVWSVEPKVDGLSVALEYRDGVFVRGATRGDGRVGEDVTENLRTIRSIPMTLPEKLPRLIVRGEVYMARSVFDEINARRELEGKPLNRALRDGDGDIYDIVAGKFFLCGLGDENFASLPKELQQKYEEKFRQPEAFLKMGSKSMAIPTEPAKAAGKGKTAPVTER